VLKVTFEGDVAMMAARNSAFSEKRDLHIGGLGANGQAALADPWIDDAIESSQPFLRKVRDAVENANHALRENPWAAMGLVAALGLTVGYLLSRRS
jgi:hypothetical protein